MQTCIPAFTLTKICIDICSTYTCLHPTYHQKKRAGSGEAKGRLIGDQNSKITCYKRYPDIEPLDSETWRELFSSFGTGRAASVGGVWHNGVPISARGKDHRASTETLCNRLSRRVVARRPEAISISSPWVRQTMPLRTSCLPQLQAFRTPVFRVVRDVASEAGRLGGCC